MQIHRHCRGAGDRTDNLDMRVQIFRRAAPSRAKSPSNKVVRTVVMSIGLVAVAMAMKTTTSSSTTTTMMMMLVMITMMAISFFLSILTEHTPVV